MDTKLTLKLDQEIIENAKKYAKSKEISLSKLIESYLATLTNKKKKSSNITPLVKSLSGVIKIDKDLDTKEEYRKYLTEKYK